MFKFGFFKKINLDQNFSEVIKDSSLSLIVKLMGLLCGFGVSIFLGRTIGAEGLGIINLSNRIAFLILLFTVFGFGNVVIKKVAIAKSNNDYLSITSIVKTSFFFNTLLSFVAVLAVFFFVPYLSSYVFKDPNLKIPLAISVLMVIPQTISRVYASALNGTGKIWQGNLVNQVLSNWIVCIGLLLYYFFYDKKMNIVDVAILYGIGKTSVSLIVFFYWKSLFKFKGAISLVTLKPMLKMAYPLLIVSGTSFIMANLDVLMLGILSDSGEVGRYSVAARLALLVSFLLQITNSVISPRLAKMYAKNEIKEMKFLVNKVTGILFVVGLLFLSFFILFGKFILSFWGTNFIEGYGILIVLSIGQFFNIATGCAGLLLVMCGYEKDQGRISFTGLILNVILNVILIKMYGAYGAALSTAITVIFINLSRLVLVKKRLNILTIPNGSFLRYKKD